MLFTVLDFCKSIKFHEQIMEFTTTTTIRAAREFIELKKATKNERANV